MMSKSIGSICIQLCGCQYYITLGTHPPRYLIIPNVVVMTTTTTNINADTTTTNTTNHLKDHPRQVLNMTVCASTLKCNIHTIRGKHSFDVWTSSSMVVVRLTAREHFKVLK